MARKPSGMPTGRPNREFDQRTFEEACYIQCTVSEIESLLHTDQRILEGWCQATYGESFDTVRKRFAEGGKASVRRNQLKLSATNASAAIWLGKVLLGQRDMAEIDERINRALGILDAAKRLKVVDEYSNTLAETIIEPTTSDSKV